MCVVSLLATLSPLLCFEETGNTSFAPAARPTSRASNRPLGGITAAGLLCETPYSLNSQFPFYSAAHLFYLPLFNLPNAHSWCAHRGLCLCQPSVKKKHSTLTSRRDDENQGEEADIHFKSEWSWQTPQTLGSVADDVTRWQTSAFKDTGQGWRWCFLKA